MKDYQWCFALKDVQWKSTEAVRNIIIEYYDLNKNSCSRNPAALYTKAADFRAAEYAKLIMVSIAFLILRFGSDIHIIVQQHTSQQPPSCRPLEGRRSL
jgi:hypothetical protein